MGAIFSCTEERKRSMNWKRFYRRKISKDEKFNRTTLFQQVIWFLILIIFGFIGQLMFRLYFNAWNVCLPAYALLFFMAYHLRKTNYNLFSNVYFFTSIIFAIWVMFGCFWGLAIYDALPWFLQKVFKSIFEFFGLFNNKFQYETKFDLKKKKFIRKVPDPYGD